MTFDEFKTAPCVVEPDTSGQCGTNPDSRCADPEFAWDNPTICPNASYPTGLLVIPSGATVEIGGKQSYMAYLQFANGQGKDVTEKSVWSTAQPGIAGISTAGLATGVSLGDTLVQAVYRGYAGTAGIEVIAACSQAEMDIVLILDRSAGMAKSYPEFQNQVGHHQSILEMVQQAARSLVENARLPSIDRIAVVSCSGIYDEGGTTVYSRDAQLLLGLSGVKDDIYSAIDSIRTGACFSQAPKSPILCATGLGAGLQKAEEELLSIRSRPGARKVAVLVSLGYEVFGDPDPVAVASTMHDQNMVIVGIVCYPETDYVTSTGGTLNNWTYIEAMVSCDFFYPCPSPGDISSAMGRALGGICEKQNNPCMYYIPWAGDPPPPAHYRDQLDYDGWKNWNVVKGFVDLIGIDLYPLQPGHGLFMDLVGTDQGHEQLDKQAVGTIESKTAFALGPGVYRLSFKLAGNLRQDHGEMSVRVSVGTVMSELITVTDWQQQFTEYQIDFTVSNATSARIRFEHQPLLAGYLPTVGLLLDDVNLTNLDTSEILLNDSFDSENPS